MAPTPPVYGVGHWKRLADDCDEIADELEAAIAAQVALWERRVPVTQDCQSSIAADAISRCIADLQGKEGPEPNG
jgi:hypothetical protein